MSEIDHYLGVAVQAAYEAGHILREGFQEEQRPKTKGGLSYDLVTEYDHRADERIRHILGRAFPAHGLLTEESGQVGDPEARFQWVVDPLDGTTNFAHSNAFFCTTLALLDAGELPLVGVVYDPIRHQLYTAVRGQGSHRDGEPITVSRVDALEQSLVHVVNPYRAPDGWYSHLQGLNAHGIRHHGATALELAQLAAGAAEAFWGWGSKPWDIAAGALLVSEAGGRVTSYRGGPWDEGRGVVATNGLVHEEVLALLERSPAVTSFSG